MVKAFEFGENWKHYSTSALTIDRVALARKAFVGLTEGIPLGGSKFLDIGFGQGLAALTAASAGAKVDCVDIDPQCTDALRLSSRFFSPEVIQNLNITIGSILSESVIRALFDRSPVGYDVVHSWGALHHTGNLNNAFFNSAQLVKPGGYFIVAIYNRHWSSPVWRLIKRLYCGSPKFVKKLLVGLFLPIIFGAKFLATGENPLDKERGMDFFFDVVDWIGGYPYQYASIQEILDLAELSHLELVRVIPSDIAIGCNEFVFRSFRDLNRALAG